jgi:hypothetical protein
VPFLRTSHGPQRTVCEDHQSSYAEGSGLRTIQAPSKDLELFREEAQSLNVSVRVSGPAKDLQVFFCEEEAQSLNVSGEGFKDLLKGLWKLLQGFSELRCECVSLGFLRACYLNSGVCNGSLV